MPGSDGPAERASVSPRATFLPLNALRCLCYSSFKGRLGNLAPRLRGETRLLLCALRRRSVRPPSKHRPLVASHPPGGRQAVSSLPAPCSLVPRMRAGSTAFMERKTERNEKEEREEGRVSFVCHSRRKTGFATSARAGRGSGTAAFPVPRLLPGLSFCSVFLPDFSESSHVRLLE